MSRAPKGKRQVEHNSSMGFWADGQFVTWSQLRREVDEGFTRFVNANLTLRRHLLPKSYVNCASDLKDADKP